VNRTQLLDWVSDVPLVSTALRWYAHQFRDGSVVTIRHGYAAGYRWRRYHRYVNGYWIGHYELRIQQALQRHVQSGETFFDIGANAGFFMIVAAKFVGPVGRCIAFDPSPENYASVVEQLALNRLTNCQAACTAIGPHDGTAVFSSESPGASTGHLGDSMMGELQTKVTVTTLDTACEQFALPDFIKMDIEGAEVEALRGAQRLLSETRPSWLIELHGAECERGVRQILCGAGYEFQGLDGRRLEKSGPWPRHVLAIHPRRPQ
jgi:FkbM family methyltransferase